MDQLLQAGADPSAPSTAGSEGEACRQLELEFREDHEIRMQSEERAEEHIRRDYNVARCGEGFKTPLHFAARKGHINIVKLLLNAGVDFWATAYDGTALHYAAIEGHEDVFQLLWEAGINVLWKECSGRCSFPYGPRFRRFPSPPPIPDLNFSQREVDLTAKSSSHGTANAKASQEEAMKHEA